MQASDPDNDALTYTATGLPSGLSINATTGLISGSIASTDGSDTPYSVTVTASDGPHTASDTFTWTVANQAVTVTNPGTQSNAEGANVSLPINASDPSGNGLSYTATGLPAGLQIDYASGIISGTMDGAAAETNGGVYQVTVLADDGQGNNGSTAFTWNVSHTNQAPTLTNPGDQLDQTGDVVSLPLSGYDGDGDVVSYTATGLPPGLILSASSGLITGTLASSAASSTPYSVTVTASDATLTASQSFNWFVTANPVTLTSPSDQTNTEGNSVSLQLSATDANNLALTYQASGLPSGLSINGGSGLISGTVSSGDAANGPYSVIVTATDAQGYTSAQQFTWTVNAANLNPVVTNPGSQINKQGDVLSLQMQATDPAGNGLTYSATGLPTGLTINGSSGLISGVLPNNSASSSPYSVTVTATDGTYSGNSTFTWSVTNQAVTVTNPGTQSSTGGGAVSLQINASDPAQQPLTYTAVGLPPGATIDASTGLISGTLGSTDGGAYAVTAMANDSQGNSGSAAFTWNVSYVNQAPTLANPGDQLNNAGDAVSVQLSGSDVDGDTVSYSATGLPQGLSLDPASGIISGTLSATAGSGTPYSVTVTASDGTLTTNQTFNWFVLANPVTVTSPGDQTNSEGDTVSLQLSATDANNSALSYQASGLPSGVSINSGTGLVSGTVASGDSANGPYSVTVTATDAKGYTSAQQFAWNVNAPSNALSLTNPGNQSNAEGDTVSLQVQASDADGDTLQYAASGLPIGLMIDPTSGLISGSVDYSAAEIAGGQYNVTVTANDGNGQTVSQSFVWAIADTPQAPWLEYPEFQDSQSGTAASLQLVGGSPDGKDLTYSATGLPAGLTVNATTGAIGGTITAAAGSYTVTATVTDTSNLTATQTFTWQVASGAAPQVLLSFDGQPVGNDFLAGVGAATPIPVLVTLVGASAGMHTVQISIPSGEAVLNQPSFQLADGGSETIEMTAEEASQSYDDLYVIAYVDDEEADDAKGTDVKVTIAGAQNGGHIRNSDTPAGMEDRIPPMNSNAKESKPYTEVAFTITPTLKDAKVVWFSVYGNSGILPTSKGNGTAKLLNSDDSPRYMVYSQESGTLYVVGMDQTVPGKSGNLFIEAMPGTQKDRMFASADSRTELAKSAGFSVAAIPILVAAGEPELAEGTRIPTGPNRYLWGASYKLTITSDSGSLADLDQVKISEKIVNQRGPTGIFAKDTDQPIVWSPPSALQRIVITDYNGRYLDPPFGTPIAITAAALKDKIDKAGNGKLVARQSFIFSDARTGVPANADGSGAMTVTKSGFQITLEAFRTRKGNYWIFVTRESEAENGAQPGQNAYDDLMPAKIE